MARTANFANKKAIVSVLNQLDGLPALREAGPVILLPPASAC